MEERNNTFSEMSVLKIKSAVRNFDICQEKYYIIWGQLRIVLFNCSK